MINSRDIAALHPIVQAKANHFISGCTLQNLDVIITSTYRDAASQDALYAIGRTIKGANVRAKKPMGDVVTNAKAGQSFHNFRVAFDFVPIINGKAIWANVALFAQCGMIAEACGLEWAGRWTKFTEMAHCQFTGGLTLKDFQEGKTL